VQRARPFHYLANPRAAISPSAYRAGDRVFRGQGLPLALRDIAKPCNFGFFGQHALQLRSYALAGEIDDSLPTGEDICFCDGHEERPFTARDARQLHLAACERLTQLIDQQSSLPRVVVTHHAPLPECIAMADRGTWIAGNSASDLSNLTDVGGPELWVHGHIHRSIDMLRPAERGSSATPPARCSQTRALMSTWSSRSKADGPRKTPPVVTQEPTGRRLLVKQRTRPSSLSGLALATADLTFQT